MIGIEHSGAQQPEAGRAAGGLRASVTATLRRASRAAAIAFGCLLAACGGGGGGEGGEGGDEGGSPVPGPGVEAPAPNSPSVVCSGADFSGLKDFVYVSPQGSDGASCGRTSATACKTIQEGITQCTSSACAVLVRHGLYESGATIELRDSVSVYGSCRFDNETDYGWRSTIVATPAPGAPAISAKSIGSPTLVQGLVVVGKDETAAATASIAVAISDSRGLALNQTVLMSGRGGDGLSGSYARVAGADGAAGQDGSKGGAGGQNCPSGRTSAAGDGGRGGIDVTHWDDSSFGWVCWDMWSPGQRGQDSFGVKGGISGGQGGAGLWCPFRAHDAPGDGGTGGSGSPGVCGPAAQPSPRIAGSLNGIEWSASKGDDGQSGGIGSGGGGGGPGGACCFSGSNGCYQGLPGGGGGGGGCGGSAGGGGEQGGASIALVLDNSVLAAGTNSNSIAPGQGGHGGIGGDGAPGGNGGASGAGQTEGRTLYLAHWCGGAGGAGGPGGWGGAGGGGAGGHGGPSIGIAVNGNSSVPDGKAIFYPGLAGSPGRGGYGAAAAPVPGACPGKEAFGGSAGLASSVFDFAKSLSIAAVSDEAFATGKASGTAVDAGSAAPGPIETKSLVPSCPASLVAGGHDYHGLTLTLCNFSGMDLSKANFRGAKLTAVLFVRTNLTDADFSGASFADSGDPVLPTDFSLADLTGAKFVAARFVGRTYLSHATLSCSDFSNTDLLAGQAVFGPDPLRMDPNLCRPSFQHAVMNCELIAQWDQLDLSNAQISACANELQTVVGHPGRDFSGGFYSGVVFDGLDLSRSKWTGAVLEHASFQNAKLDNATGLNGSGPGARTRLSGAKFNNASVQNVDLSHAELYGASFTHANLSNSSLANSQLSNHPNGTPPINNAADFSGAHMRDVNLSAANLAGVSFSFASFYGSFNVIGHGPPVFPCKTDTGQCGNTQVTGYTCSCATAVGAEMTRTDFGNAYLYGVDFSGHTTLINGANFSNAILVGSNFDGTNFLVDPSLGGAQPRFPNAFLQGVNLAGAVFDGTSFEGAYLDFEPGGNAIQILLGNRYTGFAGWKAPGRPVCVQLDYTGLVSRVPITTANTTCPDGFQHPDACGATPPRPAANPRWKASIPIGQAVPPGFYSNNATYADANQNGACNSDTTDFDW